MNMSSTIPGSSCFSFPWQQLTQLQTLKLEHYNLVEYTKQRSTTRTAQRSNEPGSRTHTTSSSTSGVVATPNPVAVLTTLTRLQMLKCNISSPKQLGLGSLSILTNLRHLKLVDVKEETGSSPEACSTALGSALQQLVQLTHLSMDLDCQFSKAALTTISSLQQLKELHLGLRDKTAASMTNLPTTLTRLVLKCPVHTNNPITASSMPSLCQLTGLLHLGLYEVQAFEPALLTNMQRLQHLDLQARGIGLLWERHLDAAAVPSLLEALPQLTELRTLNLCNSINYTLAASKHHLWTGLTAPSLLTSLELLGCYLSVQDMDEDEDEYGDEYPLGDVLSRGVQVLFRQSVSLPGLRRLRLGRHPDDASGCDPRLGRDLWQEDEPPLGSEDMELLVSCCPGLQELWLVNAVQDINREPNWPLFTALTGLTALTNLAVGGPAVDDGVVERVLAGMTGLQELMVAYSKDLSEPGVLPLTALTALTRLCVRGYGEWSEEGEDSYDWFSRQLTIIASGDAPSPDVSKQLEEHCKDKKTCLRMMVEQRGAKLAEQDGRVGFLERQLADSQTQLAEAHQQLVDLRAQLEQLQQDRKE